MSFYRIGLTSDAVPASIAPHQEVMWRLSYNKSDSLFVMLKFPMETSGITRLHFKIFN